MRLAAICGIFCLSFMVANVYASTPLQLNEQKVKAGLIYNFIKYSHWPEGVFSGPEQPFQICLVGGDAFDGALDPMQGRTAQKRIISIKRVSRPEMIYGCHVAFIHRNQKSNLSPLLETAKFQHILTVSDIDNFSALGGMVEFSNPRDRRVHLYLNHGAINEAGLQVGDQLVKLAETR